MKKILLILAFLAVASFQVSAASSSSLTDATHIISEDLRELRPDRGKSRIPKISMSQFELSSERRTVRRTVGQSEKFWTKDFRDGKYYQIDAKLAVDGKYCLVYIEEGREVASETARKIADAFDSNIYARMTDIFGNEAKPGIDGEDKVFLLMYDIKDGFQKSGDGYYAGYFFSGDMMKQSEFQSFSKVHSNEKEMLHLDLWPSDISREDYLSVLAHEFQHLIHFSYDSEETSWVNEGCSQIAAWFCGYGIPEHVADYQKKPDRSLNYWPNYDPYANYGQSFLWNLFIDRKCLKTPEMRRKFFNTIISSKHHDINGYEEALKMTGKSFSEVFSEFCATNYLNTPDFDNGKFFYGPDLSNFRHEITKVIDVVPSEYKNSVNVWAGNAVRISPEVIKDRIKIEFSGYKRSLKIVTDNSYFVMVFLKYADSANNKHYFVPLYQDPGDKVHINSVFEIAREKDLKDILLIIQAIAPENVDHAKYAGVPGLPYSLKFSEL
ncbi:MAG: hypothetical protein HQM10_17115 [Candidatus Riflebacteria bacterium]|nr:hypothetical protein [Candidatus Riflebacteria bacterium]